MDIIAIISLEFPGKWSYQECCKLAIRFTSVIYLQCHAVIYLVV